MRLRSSLPALLVLFLCSAAHALQSVRASGLACTAVGDATVATSAQGDHLQMSNFKIELDGCDVQVANLDGHHLQCASSWSGADDGTVLSFSWSVASVPASSGSSRAAVSGLHRTTGGVEWACDLSQLSSSPSMTCLLYLQGALVSSLSCPSSSTFTLQDLSPVVSQIPDVAFELDHPTQRCLSSLSLASSALFVFGGVSLEVDRVVCVADLNRDGILDLCAVRCASPPSSGVRSLDFSGMSCVRSGASVSFAGLDLDASPDLMHVQSNPLYTAHNAGGESPLFRQLFGSGGAGGGGGGGLVVLKHIDKSSPLLAMEMSPTSPLVLDPHADDGAALECRLLGTGTCSPDGEVAEMQLAVSGQQLVLSHRFTGMCADQEELVVRRRGRLVGTLPLIVSQSLTVVAPPGGSTVTPVCAAGVRSVKSSSNIQNNLVGPGRAGREAPAAASRPGAGTASAVVASDGLDLHVAFVGDRVVCVGGTCLTGDDFTLHGQCSSGSCNVITIVGSNFSLQRSVTGSGAGSSLDVLGFPSSGLDQVSAGIPATVALTSSVPVAQVPVVIERVDTTPARGASVTLHLSPNLVLSSAALEGDYFSRFGTTQMFVVDNGGGSYTVDDALLGPGCGPTDSGTLFSLPVARAPGAADGLGFVSIDAVDVADCSAGPIPSSPGGKSWIVLDATPPSPVTLSVSQVTSGNDGDGTIKLALSWSAPEPLASLELYRAPFGNYPEYENGSSPGSPPPPLTLPAAGKWSRTNATCAVDATGASVCTDEPQTRDVYYYAVVVRDAFGNASPSSNVTRGIPNYFLGDVAGGGAVCSGDNRVTAADVSALGFHYGETLPVGSSLECLDVGPTDNGAVDGRPLTDHKLSFKDLILYAINYSLVSRPAEGARPLAAATNALRLRVAATPAVGQTFDVAVEMSGAGDAQGVSAQLAYDAAVVEPVAVAGGDLLTRQGRESVVLSAQPGDVDAALLGVGAGIAGEGDLAHVTFRVKTAGDPSLGIASAEARDMRNQVLVLGTTGVAGGTAGRTALRLAFPNPFDRTTTVVLSLHEPGPASVRVFDVAGRAVRTLLSGVQPAGERVLAWDGRDDGGTRLVAGVYLLRLDAGGHRETRALRLVK